MTRHARTPADVLEADVARFAAAMTDVPEKPGKIWKRAFPDAAFRAIYCSHLCRLAFTRGLCTREGKGKAHRYSRDQGA
ncbi:MAG: ABC transporter permease [Candidatus Omnitrophica bacterium]|nr:ABC transporter permease [Candidatus Omnitrophota bacterium]